MESKRGCYPLSLSLSRCCFLSLLFLGTSRATTSRRDREGWVGGWVVVGRWIGRASINQAVPEGFTGGRDRGKKVVKDRREKERERVR